MKVFALLFGAAGIAAGMLSPGRRPEPVLLIAGDARGYLSPCGCTEPMSGGILRLGTAVRAFSMAPGTTFVYSGGLTGKRSRQEELKAETLAEALSGMKAAAIGYTSSEARFGTGMLLALHQLSEGRFTTASVASSAKIPLPPYIESGSFLIGSVAAKADLVARPLGEEPLSAGEATQVVIDEARARKLIPLILFDGTRGEAENIAKELPVESVFVYSSTGSAPQAIQRVGHALLVTPGENGKQILRLAKNGESWSYSAIDLGPEFKDDSATDSLYRLYLSRVEEENLIAKFPRSKGDSFAGNDTCGSCHSDAQKAWVQSGHAHALETLEKAGHAKDPDCVACHVTGLDKTTGFRSRSETPSLTDVGCESCHGAGSDHAKAPTTVKMGKVGAQSCMPCHTLGNSPKFKFEEYWRRIAH